MAAPIDFTATEVSTIEGQLLMILQEIMSLQEDTTADTGTNRDNEQIILASNYNDATGIQATTLSISVTTKRWANGYALIADEIFYPKV